MKKRLHVNDISSVRSRDKQVSESNGIDLEQSSTLYCNFFRMKHSGDLISKLTMQDYNEQLQSMIPSNPQVLNPSIKLDDYLLINNQRLIDSKTGRTTSTGNSDSSSYTHDSIKLDNDFKRTAQYLSKAKNSRRSSTSVISSMRRWSLGKLPINETLIYLNDKKLGSIPFKCPSMMLHKARYILLSSFPALEGSCFCFNTPCLKRIDREEEETIHVSYCIGDNNLNLSTKEITKEKFDDFKFSEEKIRGLATEADETLRRSFRILENTSTMKYTKNPDSTLPKLSKDCVRFVRRIARATIDSCSSSENQDGPDIKWKIVQQLVARLEKQLLICSSRQELAEWWYYREDQANVTNIVKSIQKEFRQSKKIRMDHPIFSFKLRALSSEILSFVDVLHEADLFKFTGKKYESERTRLANFIGVSPDQLRRDILARKNKVFFDLEKENSLFCSVESPTAYFSKANLSGSLRSDLILNPIMTLQESILNESAEQYCFGTREWAFDAFDVWIENSRNSSRCLMFTAPSGWGKTVFASKLVRCRSQKILAYFFCRHDDHRFQNAKVMLMSIVNQISVQSRQFEECLRRKLTAKKLSMSYILSPKFSIDELFFELLLTPLLEVSVSENDAYVILLDGIDEAKDASNGILDMIRDMFQRLPSWILFCFTTTSDAVVLKKLRRFKAQMISPKENLNATDLKLFLDKSLPELTASRESRERDMMIRDLAYNARESFLFYQLIMSKVEGFKTLSDAEEYLMLNLESLLQREFNKLCTSYPDLFRNIVKLCLAAAEALTVEIISDILGIDLSYLRKVMFDSRTFFVQQRSIVRWSHKLCKEWMLETLERPRCYASADASLKIERTSNRGETMMKCHAFLAKQIKHITYCEQDESFSKLHAKTKDYLLHYGVHHLVFGDSAMEAKELLLNPTWLLSQRQNSHTILQAFGLLSEGDQMLALVARAISMSFEAIQNDFRQLIGQLIGRLQTVSGDRHDNGTIKWELANFLNKLRNFDFGFEWWCPIGPTWDQAEQPQVRSMYGHKDSIQCVAWHHGGKMCASGSWDGDIRVWNTLYGECIALLIGHKKTVWAVDWEPFGSRLVSASSDRSVRVWDTVQKLTIGLLVGHTDCVWDVRWSRDARVIASASKDKTIRLWDANALSCLKVLLESKGSIYSLSWEGGIHSKICAGSTDNLVLIWDTHSGLCIAELHGHKDWIRSVDWCNIGGYILSASADTTVRIWNTDTLQCQHVLMGHTNTVWSVSSSPDGCYAVSGSCDGTIRIWDCFTGREEQSFQGHKGAVFSVSFCIDSKRIVSGSADKSLVIWDTSTGIQRKTISGHDQPIWCIDTSSDGSMIASGSADKTVRLWNVNSGLCEKILRGHSGPVFGIKYSSDEKLVATASSDNTVGVHRLCTGDRKLHLTGHTASVWCVAWSIDDSLILTGSKDTNIRIWNSKSGKCLNLLHGHTSDVKAIVTNRDGRHFASSSNDATIRVWEINTASCISVLDKPGSACLCIDWHPKIAVLLIAGYASGSVCVWNYITSEREVDFFPGHEKRVNSISWSPNGKKAVSVGSDKEIRIWNVESRCCERKINSCAASLFGVKWTERNIVSGGAEKSLQLVNPETGRCEAVLAGENENSLGIIDLALSHDGRYAVSGSRQRVVQIWNSETGACEKTLIGHTNWVHSVFWDKSERKILSRSDDGTSRLWDVSSGECLNTYLDVTTFPDNFFPVEKSMPRNLMNFAEKGQPIGIHCDKVWVRGNRACGWIGTKVHFFKLVQRNR